MTEEKPKPEGFQEVYLRKSAEEIAAGVPQAPVPFAAPKQPAAPGIVYKALKLDQTKNVALEIRQFMSAVTADPQGHPYMKKSHPLHRDYVKHIASLYELQAIEKENEPNEFELAMNAQKTKVHQAQQARIKDAERDMDFLVGTGIYEKAAIPEDINASTAKLLKIQRFFAEGRIDMANNLLRLSFNELKVPAEVQMAFKTLGEMSDGNAGTKQMHTDSIIRWLESKYKALKEFKPKPKREIDKRPNYLKKTGRGDYVL